MHNSVITVSPIETYLEVEWSFVVGDLLHLLVDQYGTGVELPIAVFVAHGIANCCQKHAGLETIYCCWKGI